MIMIIIINNVSYNLDECIEWQVNYGYQKFCKFLIKILKKTCETANLSIFNS